MAHTTENNIPIDKRISSNWKEGHPQFSPFKINQKVLKKVRKIGNQVKDKLSRRYDGPFIVVKVQSNEVTYELKRYNSLNSKLIKAHYKQLKSWKEVPPYLKNYVKFEEVHDDTKEQCEDAQSSDLSASEDYPIAAILAHSDYSEETDVETTKANRSLRKPFKSKNNNKTFVTERRIKNDRPKTICKRNLRKLRESYSSVKLVDLRKFQCSEETNYEENEVMDEGATMNRKYAYTKIKSTPIFDDSPSEFNFTMTTKFVTNKKYGKKFH